jgi:hypothetical protein
VNGRWAEQAFYVTVFLCSCLINITIISSVQAGVAQGKILTTDIANLILEYRYDIIPIGAPGRKQATILYGCVQVY